MGCDIHLYVEQRVGGKWHLKRGLGSHVPMIPEYRMTKPQDLRRGSDCWLYGDRDYDLFAILADVRNYGDQIPIFPPRGLPADVSTKVARKSEDFGLDGHSHSHVTLRELLAYPWQRWRQQEVFVHFVDAVDYYAYGTIPHVRYTGGSGGTEDVLLHPEFPLAGEFESFFNRCLPWLEHLARGNPDNVRLVYWFDN